MTEKRMGPHKGGRARTGTVVKTKSGLLQGLILLADGTRRRLPPFPPGTSREMAKERTKAAAAKALEMGIVRPAPTAKPASDEGAKWFEEWCAHRVAKGLTSVGENRSHYTNHITKVIGSKHVRDWTEEDLRKLSRELDRKIQSGDISWKTASNVWGTATSMCASAVASKDDRLRCRKDNPALLVEGPDRGESKLKEFLYPSEFLQFVSCEEVPHEWRRAVTVATYLYLRAGELRALRWQDVDLEHGIVRIHRATNRRTGEEKATKTGIARTVPIELALRPLLAAMHKEAGGRGFVVALPSINHTARTFRHWLKEANVERTSLHESSATQRNIVFHDLRGTGLTWLAVRGDDPLKIQQRAGHTDFKTTQGYVRTAEAHSVGFGETFPVLPQGLIARPKRTLGAESSLSEGFLVDATGLEPVTPAV